MAKIEIHYKIIQKFLNLSIYSQVLEKKYSKKNFVNNTFKIAQKTNFCTDCIDLCSYFGGN
jgi:hypothetical protein